MEGYKVNGLTLPQAMLTSMAEGRWPPTSSKRVLSRVFPEPAVWPQFFTAEEMVAVNRIWADESRAVFVGSAGPKGNMRTDRSLLIGQLGPDQLVALVFETSDDPNPKVYYLTGDPGGKWVWVADNTESLLDNLEAMRDDQN